ncbi:TRAP transporter large permease [Kordiimonas pumila]|uniref:TRAP transporter large permease protein n=1 Tax=Kordiimonas pumila TaxID=2161677 RepID=A0ABV7DA59_9PROT|nr:TRAP transporter large permease [Kordiimonas pumila]
MLPIGFFLTLLLLGVPIAFVLVLSAVFLVLISGDHVLFLSFHQQFFGGMEQYGLLALPLFIVVGELMGVGGMARRLVALAGLFVGNLRGGLAYVNLLANALMASILGSAVAQISVMNKVMTPEMEKQGYTRLYSVALTTSGGLLAPILPPSMLFVVYGVLAQISIGDMFIAGIVPGLMLVAGFIAVIFILGFFYEYPDTEQAVRVHWLTCLRDGVPAVLVPVVIVASILGGIATPTEAAALAGLTAIFVGCFIYKELTVKDIGPVFVRSAMTSGMILVLIGAAQIFGFVITFEQIPGQIVNWITSVASSELQFLLLLNLLLLMVGMFIDAIAALIIVVPLLLPVAVNVFGLSPFHFGVIVCLNLALGLVTPPIGAGLFVAASVSGEKAGAIAKAILPFVAVTVLVLLLLCLFPALVII